MAIQLSASVRNARLNAIETVTAGTAIVKLFHTEGSPPADCATGDAGTVVATITCPADYFNAASGGSMTLNGTWQDTSADASGTVDFFRMYENTATTCHLQGSAGTASTDLVLDNNVVTAGQQVTITAFTLTDANS